MNFNMIWLWLYILSLEQLILPNYGFPTCAEYCAEEGEFCTQDQNPDCGTWGYDQCEGCGAGYWGKGSSTVCASCLETIGCTDCEDYKGCLSCDYGGERTWWGECEIHYCDGAGTQPIGDTTTSEPDATEPGVTDTDTDTETDTDTDTETEATDSPDVETTPLGTKYKPIDIETEHAIAMFSSNDIFGSVVATRGHWFIYLNFSDFDFWNDWSDINGDNCLKGGLYWSIQEEWNYDGTSDKIGPDECSISKTGSRWDPWLACSEQSNNGYCNIYDDGCIPPFSYTDYSYDDTQYYCSQYTYNTNPFACEVGDLSGKYGVLDYNENTKSIVFEIGSPFEVDSYDLSGKSILFRCGLDQSRALCAPFEEYDVDSTSDNNAVKDYVLKDFDEIDYYRPYQNHTFSKIARLSDVSFVLLTYDNYYSINVDVSELTIPGDCGEEIIYRIFTDFDSTSSSLSSDDCDDVVGSFYDPTLTCNEDTENTEKGYCIDDFLCGNENYIYSCEQTGYYLSPDRHKCGPGDLSNKYGSIDISTNTHYWFNRTGYDSLMVPLSQIKGTSIVFQCENDYQIIACAAFEDYLDDVGKPGHVGPYDADSSEDSSDESENNSKAKEDTFLGVSQTVMTVLMVMGILTLIPCVRAICRRMGGDKTSSQVSAASLGAVMTKPSGSTAGSVRSGHTRENTHSEIESQSYGVAGAAGRARRAHRSVGSSRHEYGNSTSNFSTTTGRPRSVSRSRSRSRSISRSHSMSHSHSHSRSHSSRSQSARSQSGTNRSRSRRPVGGAGAGAGAAVGGGLDSPGVNHARRKSPIPKGFKPTGNSPMPNNQRGQGRQPRR